MIRTGRAVAVLVLLAPAASAISTGITGYSGKQGSNCGDCHSGGVTPAVRFEGPSAVYVGTLATFRFVVQSQSERQQVAGFNVAASQGRLDPIAGDGAHEEFGELTHDFPKAASDNETTWLFTWRAPPAAGTETLYGAGLSANGNGTRSGDAVALASLEVGISTAPRPGDANCDGALSTADATGIAAVIALGEDSCGLADADCSGTVNELDIDVQIANLFDDDPPTDCPPPITDDR